MCVFSEGASAGGSNVRSVRPYSAQYYDAGNLLVFARDGEVVRAVTCFRPVGHGRTVAVEPTSGWSHREADTCRARLVEPRRSRVPMDRARGRVVNRTSFECRSLGPYDTIE